MMKHRLTGLVATLALLGAGCDAPGGKADATSPDTPCRPECTNRECGSDGCGGSCGWCGNGLQCNTTTGTCGSCQRLCQGRVCGDDGCGGSCGLCAAGTQCNPASGTCETCTPDCEGATCGDDGCSGSCGTCSGSQVCNPLKRQCVEPVLPDCAGKECGDDGVGGSCGTCPTGLECHAGTCGSSPGDVIETPDADIPINPPDADDGTPPDTVPVDVPSEVADPGTTDRIATDDGTADRDVEAGDSGNEDARDTQGEEAQVQDTRDEDALDRDIRDEEVPPLPTCTQTGGYLCPCTTSNDCYSGLCVDTMDQALCSKQCFDGGDCPPGWSCEQVNVSGELLFGCIDPFASLCRPCEEDLDCLPPIGAMGRQFRCIDGGPAGSFCGAQCTRSSDCPEYEDESGARTAFECVAVATESGEVRQCRPASGQCPCTTKHRDAGFRTECYVENQYGRCTGKRTCDEECDAPIPGAEECNSLDDDCNGLADDNVPPAPCDLTNGTWTCKGTSTCRNGRWGTCTGTYPSGDSPEYGIGACNGLDDDCDGVTDQGFPDTDGDRIADCLDPDRDGDNVPNTLDNCPDASNPYQANNEGDLAGDICDPDDDDDGVVDNDDNCVFVKNTDQRDTDGDGQGDACDCDADADGVANNAPLNMQGGTCPNPGPDGDNCWLVPNADQFDTDLDGLGDACDCDIDNDTGPNNNPGCPTVEWPDNCQTVPNLDQFDTDLDGTGDACDCDIDNDQVPNGNPGCEVPPVPDNCTFLVNPVDPQSGVQADTDGDLIGDACDCDIDNDGALNPAQDCPACDPCDNCAFVANPDQQNTSGGPYGDACDNDWDVDSIPNDEDLCPYTPSTIDQFGMQPDMDADGQGDACDCDIDGDDIGNGGVDPAGEACPDVPTSDDCPRIGNPDQADLDSDGIGDACDCDIDGDGDPQPNFECPLPALPDCQPFDPAVSHLAVEKCNQIDDDCDEATDEPDALNCLTFHYDKDDDGYGTADSRCLCALDGFYRAPVPGDCNDDDAAVSPGAQEVCGNGRDDNCDGSENDLNAVACTRFHYDNDLDGYGTTEFECRCTAPGGKYTALRAGDCDDRNERINPLQSEVCNDGIDNNCSGTQNDENAANCRWFFLDTDGDTYGTSAQKCFCYGNDALKFTATRSGDCDGEDAAVNPGAREVCNNGKDDDCNGFQDTEGANDCINYYFDGDGDSFGLSGNVKCLCAGAGSHTARAGGDCQDANPYIHPEAAEVCDGVDNNCDTRIDENPTSLCEPLPDTAMVCQSGACVISECPPGYFNINGEMADGCECAQDASDGTGNTCSEAIFLGEIFDDTSSLLVSRRIVPGSDEDWYYLKAKDASDTGTFGSLGTDRFNLVVTLKLPTDGSFKVDVRRGGCGGGQTCGGVTYQWKPTAPSCISPTGDHWRCCAPGACSAGGEMAGGDASTMNACCDNVTQCTDAHNVRHCTDDQATFYIRVYHDPSFPSATICSQTEYTLEVSNGK